VQSALLKPAEEPQACSIEASIFRRKWQAGIAPGRALPLYEDIVIGSLGRLADRLLVIEGQSADNFKVLRGGRRLQNLLGADIDRKRIAELPKEFSIPLCTTLGHALKTGQPECAYARRVSGGMVETYELLVMPLWCRWGSTLLAAHISEIGTPFNLVDTMFRSTQEGILALAAVRDAEGRAIDFQIVAFNARALRLLGAPPDDLQWSYLSQQRHGLVSVALLEKLFAVLETTRNQQFELPVTIDGAEIHLSVSLAAAGDLISATLTDVTEIKRREGILPPAV
jgi:PAS domain-containing protein